MWRCLFAVIAGFVVGVIVVILVQIPGYFIHPPPANFNVSDAAAIKAHMAKAPLPAMLPVAFAWFAGPLVGSWLAAIIARRPFPALIIAVMFLGADTWNLASFPHPLWLVMVGLLAPLVATWLGVSLATRMINPPAGPQPYDMRKKNMAC